VEGAGNSCTQHPVQIAVAANSQIGLSPDGVGRLLHQSRATALPRRAGGAGGHGQLRDHAGQTRRTFDSR
jgi:hypothetical protein